MNDALTVDLNADVGEGCGNDAALFDLVTSANVACGWHAGDAATMRETVRAALARGVSIGAHPSYPDREHFGRVALERSPGDVYSDVTEQLAAISEIAREEGAVLRHVKAHGALYNVAVQRRDVADAIATAVRDFDTSLALFGLPGSALADAAVAAGLRPIGEGFADRRYTTDGFLVPRTDPDPFVEDPQEALEQTLRLLQTGVQTICLHGDDPHALLFARRLRDGLAERGIRLQHP